jgi:uncharacterized protein YjdB
MKGIISYALTIMCLVMASIAFAQTPQGIPYQAAARNSSGAVLASTNISLRFTVRDSVATGAVKYRETHNLTTSSQGMFSVKIGLGTPVSGTFASINWGTNAKFMQVELDPAGGSSFIDMGTSQLMSVPYSMHSMYSMNSNNGFPTGTTGDVMYHNGTNWVKLPAGIDGQFLVMNSGVPNWDGCYVAAGMITGVSVVCASSSITMSNTTAGGVWSSNNTSVATVNSAGIVTGVAAGTTIISYTRTIACGSAVVTKDVTVNPLPLAGSITGTAEVCAGSTRALSNSTTGGVWTSGATAVATIGTTGIVTGVAAGTSTISYSVSNSCGTAIANRVFTVNPLPSGGTITGTATLTPCGIGSTTTLSTTATGGNWSSSSTSVATVGSTGVVSAVWAGTSTIYYTVSNSCGTAFASRVVTVSIPLAIGDTYGGGKIAYIFKPGDPGYVACELHGLIAAPSDQSTGIQWGCNGTTVAAYGYPIGTGAANTALISSTCGAGTAARLCDDLVIDGYSDWYLPSRFEIQKFYDYRSTIGGFTSTRYWCSSTDSYTNTLATFVEFGSDYASNASRTSTYRVRAIRSF